MSMLLNAFAPHFKKVNRSLLRSNSKSWFLPKASALEGESKGESCAAHLISINHCLHQYSDIQSKCDKFLHPVVDSIMLKNFY